MLKLPVLVVSAAYVTAVYKLPQWLFGEPHEAQPHVRADRPQALLAIVTSKEVTASISSL